MLMMAMTRIRNGKAIRMSTRRMKNVSIRPPRYPVTTPMMPPDEEGKQHAQ